MTDEQLKQAAIERGLIYGTAAYRGFIEGCKWMQTKQQETFDELNPYQKADFMKNNISWARTCDLRDELKLRHEL